MATATAKKTKTKKLYTEQEVRDKTIVFLSDIKDSMQRFPKGIRVFHELAQAMQYCLPSKEFDTQINALVYNREVKKQSSGGVRFVEQSPTKAKQNAIAEKANTAGCTDCDDAEFGLFAHGVQAGAVPIEVAKAESVDDIYNYFNKNNLPAAVKKLKAKEVIDYMNADMKKSIQLEGNEGLRKLSLKIWDAAYGNAF